MGSMERRASEWMENERRWARKVKASEKEQW